MTAGCGVLVFGELADRFQQPVPGPTHPPWLTVTNDLRTNESNTSSIAYSSNRAVHRSDRSDVEPAGEHRTRRQHRSVRRRRAGHRTIAPRDATSDDVPDPRREPDSSRNRSFNRCQHIDRGSSTPSAPPPTRSPTRSRPAGDRSRSPRRHRPRVEAEAGDHRSGPFRRTTPPPPTLHRRDIERRDRPQMLGADP